MTFYLELLGYKKIQKMVKEIFVHPIFSLLEVKSFLSVGINPEYIKQIESKLNSVSGLQERFITVEPIPTKLGLILENKIIPIADIGEVFESINKEPATLPYLLGLIAKEKRYLINELRSAQSIEILAYPETFSFDSGVIKRESWLCLRRINNKLVLGISEYLKKGMLNNSERISVKSIKTVFFEEKKEIDLSILRTKMIA